MHELSESDKSKFIETEILVMNLIVDGIKENLIPYISNIDSAQEMYEALSKLFTIKNLHQIASLENELRTITMTKEDILSSYFIKISRIRDELQAIDEIVPEKGSCNHYTSRITNILEFLFIRSQ